MLPPAELKLLIARLDPGSLTSLVGSLLLAELARLGMPPNALAMSDDLNEADEGLDGRIDGVPAAAPDGTPPSLPPGLVGFQLKAVRRKQQSALNLDEELRKPGPRALLEAGGTYVLVWSQDLNPPQRQATENALVEAAREVVDEPSTAVWDAMTLARLCQLHPAAAIDNGLLELGPALSLPELLTSSTLKADQRPWQSDPARDQHIARIRQRAAEPEHPILMQLLGDPGTGKTRLVAEALDTDELRDSVLYINGAEGLGLLLTHLIRQTASSGIVFVDEIDDHDVATAASRIGGLSGRWRLISVTSRGLRRWQPEGPRDMVVEPLSAEATTRLVVQHSGLSEADARRVADVASGFPELAFRLADELRANPGLDLVTLSRLRQPQEILRRALHDDETRRHLAPLALFTSVGFDEDLRYQLEAVADAFGVDAQSVERYADGELGRFISRAGRYRLVSPRLVAIWLASDLIERTPRIADIVFALPEPLRNAFVEQLDFFGPDVPHLPAALSQILDDERFRRPASFDEAAGRLLRASAAIVPAQVVDAIVDLLARASEDELRSLPRRDLVWALEVLLWWPETWQRAIESMFLLARHESEDYANNATAQFAQFFSVVLSGTTVPFAERARWLRDAINGAEAGDLPLLVNASAAALKAHHTRSVTGFRGGGEPEDWRPGTADEFVEARRTGWDLLLLCRDRSDDLTQRASITEKLANSIRTAYRSALGPHVERTLRDATWELHERAELAAGVRDLLRYEPELPAELREAALSLHEWLLGESLDERGSAILSTSTWELRLESETVRDPPELLRDLAARVLQEADPVGVALALGRDLPDQETRYQLLRALVRDIGAERLGTSALTATPPDWTAVAAAFSAADEQAAGQWATRTLSEVVRRQAPERLPQLLRFLKLTPERIDVVLDAVNRGLSRGDELAALLYGAPVVELEEEYARRIVEVVAANGRVEEALGMFDQWLQRHDERSEEVRATASELARLGVRQGGGTMVDHYLRRLLDAGGLSSEVVLELWRERMIHRAGLAEELDQRLTERALADDPEAMTEQMLELIRRQAVGEGTFGLYASGDLALLSRAARASSVETVWNRVDALSRDELRWAMHHMDWSGMEPEPLVRRLLTSARLAEVDDEASSCFFNTLGTVVGSMARALEGELARARAWEMNLADTSAVEWARKLVTGYESSIAWERQREEERDMRFR